MIKATRSIPGGFILVARSIRESELIQKPAHYLKIWLWLLTSANWRDGDKLKRGQLFTTTRDLQIACGFRSGNSFRSLTPDEVRSAYGYLRNTGAITISKTTRGMIITIVNYNVFQNQSNYGPRAESHGENRSESSGTPYDTEGMKKERTVNAFGGREELHFDYDAQAWTNVTDDVVNRWREEFPGVDVPGELEKARRWCLANPTRVKRNWFRFITKWLSRSYSAEPIPEKQVWTHPQDEVAELRMKGLPV